MAAVPVPTAVPATTSATSMGAATSSSLVKTTFEVHGRVQGVFFRKYTQKKATELKLCGWCRNTAAGTVQGVAEGDAASIAAMKKWLQETGSPQSRISKTDFKDEEIASRSCSKFTVAADS